MYRKALSDLANKVGIVGLDIGARRGVNHDLKLLGLAAENIGFDPDPVECDRLNRDSNTAGNIRYLPLALSAGEESFVLNIYRQKGCSSKLFARKDYGEQFLRGEYYIPEDRVTVQARAVDDLIANDQIPPPSFLKIDVQGMEAEVFQGASGALANSVVGIRTEVSFVQLYEGQPLFTDIDLILRRYGFLPMQYIEFHEWRRLTKIKYPALKKGDIPYSRGQMVHADVLYLLDPELIPDEGEGEIKRLIRLALIALCYEQIDHAEVIFHKSGVRRYCKLHTGVDPLVMVDIYSKWLARQTWIPRMVAKLYSGLKRQPIWLRG
jgi:FkbM family methyltransferase